MENNKLKKLGKYFTKGLQAGVLATALIAGNVSCSNAAGGSSAIEDDYNGGNGGNGNQTTWPNYYISTEFGGQRFVDTDEEWFYDDQDVKNEKFEKRYNNADQFINEKKEALQDLWSKKNNGSNLENKIYDVLSNFNQGTTISSQIDNNYDAVAEVFAIIDGQNQNSTADYYTFKAAYHKLAANAYTKAIANYVNNTNESDNFPTLTETPSLLNSELKYVESGKYNSDTFTFEQARATMQDSLATIATRNYANSELLNKFVELALYNESLYGLNDYAKRVNVKVSGLEANSRAMRYLQKKIEAKTTSLSLDDRTM